MNALSIATYGYISGCGNPPSISDELMNVTYAKEEVILESVVSVLRADNNSTGVDVESIESYVEDRILRPFPSTTFSFPRITVEVNGLESDFSIATREFIVDIDVWIKFDYANALTTLGRIAARIEALLNRRQELLNSRTSKNLRCRVFQLIGSSPSHDALAELHSIKKSFRCVCDDEILTL